MLHTRARARQIRWILNYGCIPYSDVIVQFDTWPSVKSDQSKCLFSQVSKDKLCKTYFYSFDNRMSAMQTILGEEKFLGGNAQPCHADFSLFHIVDTALTVKPDALDTFPALKDWLVHMMAIPSLQKYMKDRLQPSHVGKDKSFIRET